MSYRDEEDTLGKFEDDEFEEDASLDELADIDEDFEEDELGFGTEEESF